MKKFILFLLIAGQPCFGQVKVESASILSGKTIPYESFGTVLNDQFARASLGSDYITTGASSWTCDGSKLNVSGGAGTATHRCQWYYINSFEDVEFTFNFTLNSVPSGTTFGIGTGFSDLSSPDGERTIYFQFNTSTGANGGKCFIVGFDGTTVTVVGTSSGTLVRTNGDSYTMSMTKKRTAAGGGPIYTLTVTKDSDQSKVYTTWKEVMIPSQTVYANSTGYFSMFSFGGSFAINNWVAKVADLKKAKYLFVGHSIWHGLCAVNQMNKRFASQLSYLGNYEVTAGSGDGCQRAIDKLTNLTDYNPVYYIVCAGLMANDKAFGVSSATYQSNYSSLITSLKATGKTVIHVAPSPRTGNDVSGIRTWLLSTFSGDTIIDPYTGMLGTGTDLSATYDSGDGVHWNQAGHDYVAGLLQTGLP